MDTHLASAEEKGNIKFTDWNVLYQITLTVLVYLLFIYLFIYLIIFTTAEKQAVVGVAQQSKALN